MATRKQEEVSTVTGYKDKLVGGVKETVGSLLGIEKMEKEGTKQKEKGEAELKAAMAQQRAIGDRERQQRALAKGPAEAERLDPYFWVKRQAVISEIQRTGGLEHLKWHLRHVDPREPDLRSLLKESPFKLRRWDKNALLNDIRQRKTKRPLVHVETQEKGLLRNIKLDKNDFQLKRIDRMLNNLWGEIRGFNLNKLRKVSPRDIRDRSAPRLDLLKKLKVGHQQHEVLLREVVSGPPRLRHVETNDKTKPSLFYDKNVHVHRIEKDKLLNEVRKGLDQMKHVETCDKAKPMIEKDIRIKKYDKKPLLAEVRRGTKLRHAETTDKTMPSLYFEKKKKV